MRNRLEQLFRLREGEALIVFTLGFVLFLNAAAMQISSVSAVSGFLSEIGVEQILVVWIIDFSVILGMSALQSLVVDKVNRIKLSKIVLAAFLVAVAGIRLLFVAGAPDTLNYTLLYLLTDQQWLFFPAVFWVLTNDVFTMSQGKRLFPVISSFGLAGKLFGLGLSLVSPGLFRSMNILPIDILWVNVAIYAAALALLHFGLRGVVLTRPSPREIGAKHTLSEGAQFIRTVPMFRYLTLSIVLLVVCDTIIEFNFLSTTDRAYGANDGFQEFYATFRIGVILVSLVAQSVLTSRLIERIQLKNAFFLLPVTMLIVALGALVIPGAGSGIVAMLLTQIVRDTTNDSASKSLQSLVPEEKRGRVSMFMESYLTAAGTIAGSILTGAIVLFAPRLGAFNVAPVYLVVCVIGALLAVAAIVAMRRSYESSMFNWRLTRRKRASDILSHMEF
jgi:ATP:ADP antiporter, AAA family